MAAVAAGTFDPAMTAELPEAARRWLGHAIAPGTPLRNRAELAIHGQIKLGRWRPFTARQVLAPPGCYLWAATARLAGLPVTGYDRLGTGGGEMRWRLLRLIPAAFRHAAWSRAECASTAIATWRFGDDTEAAEPRVEAEFFRAEITGAVFSFS